MTAALDLLAAVIPPRYGATQPGVMRDLTEAVAGMLNGPMDMLDRAQAGTLTDPAATPDTWIRWLATCLGVPQASTVAETRRLAVNRASVSTAGSAAAIADLVRSYLTGSRSAVALPTAGQPWMITIGVRADEAPEGDLPGLGARIVATGQVPAGFTIQVTALDSTWTDYEQTYAIWSDLDGVTWARRDSAGVLA